MGAQDFRRRTGQRGALAGSPALMPELLVLALAAAGRVPDDGRLAAAAAHDVAVSKIIQDGSSGRKRQMPGWLGYRSHLGVDSENGKNRTLSMC
jgi:hypothetical protein